MSRLEFGADACVSEIAVGHLELPMRPRVLIVLSVRCHRRGENWFNDSTDALAQEVAHHIARSASGGFDMEATIRVSDEG